MKTLSRKEWVGATILWQQVIKVPILFGLFRVRRTAANVSRSTVLDVSNRAICIGLPNFFGKRVPCWIAFEDIHILETLPPSQEEPEEPSWT